MASTPIGGKAAPVTLPGTIPPMPAVARILSRYDRGKLAAFVTVAIDLLDALDGDPEAEELPLEDAFVGHNTAFADMDSDGRDISWPEWHTRGRRKLLGGAEMQGSMIHEDAEDDDPAGQLDEDYWTSSAKPGDPNGGAGCPISDPGEHGDDAI